MAKQVGPNFIAGTIGNITYYQLNGKYYARLISSLTKERVKTDPHFQNTMRNAGAMGQASKIASAIYRQIPVAERQEKVYRVMTGVGYKWLKQEMPREEVMSRLTKEYLSQYTENLVVEKAVKRVEPSTRSTEGVLEIFSGNSQGEDFPVPIDGPGELCRAYPVPEDSPFQGMRYRSDKEKPWS